MPKSLTDLHGARITLECDINGRAIVLSGIARYVRQPVGNQLCIDIKDADGDFTFVLDEATWDGAISREAGGYRIMVFTSKNTDQDS